MILSASQHVRHIDFFSHPICICQILKEHGNIAAAGTHCSGSNTTAVTAAPASAARANEKERQDHSHNVANQMNSLPMCPFFLHCQLKSINGFIRSAGFSSNNDLFLQYYY